ncbi:MAG: cupredoxin domain-containing protein, partial [Actinomycetota bacterium]|nr:cupredoxin domain-containing protein [Actinomycetota bacterium]
QGCPPATHVAIVGGEPFVVVADPRSGELIAAQRQGGTWATEVVATDVTGGASLAAAGDTATISFYTSGGVALATGRFGSWSIEEVATLAQDGGQAGGTTTPGSGVAVDGQGTTWVTWEDGEGIHLASGEEGQLEELDLPDTSGGVSPTVATTEDGSSVYLAWYDPENGDLRLGTYAEIPGLLIAAPSPAPSVVVAPVEGCGDDGQLVLEIAASGSAFDKNCLVAPAGEPFTITFDNQDPAPTTHNVAIFPDPESTDPIFGEDPFAGPQTVDYNVPPLDGGVYPFRCEVHPTTMTGVLAAIEAGGGGGGGSGTGGGGG